jgi:hypothetical protein
MMKDSGAVVGVSRHSGGIGGANTGRIAPSGGQLGAVMISAVGTPVGDAIGTGVGSIDAGANVGLSVGLEQHASLHPTGRSLPSVGHRFTQPAGSEVPFSEQKFLHPRGKG